MNIHLGNVGNIGDIDMDAEGGYWVGDVRGFHESYVPEEVLVNVLCKVWADLTDLRPP